MKKLHELTLGAAFTLLALSACDNEALLPDAPQMNEPDNPNACVLVAKDFHWEGNESRTALTIDGNVAKFSWTTGDKVGILPDEGAQVYFTIPEAEALAEGDELTDEQHRKASFDGGAWALKAESNYAAYYPFIKDFDLPRAAVPVKYTGQKQTGNNNAAHLGVYDYMGARPVTTNANGGGVTFDFDHVGALVLLEFTVPEANTALKSVTLSADEVTFTTEGTYDLTSAEGFPITSTATAASMTIGLDYTTTADDEVVTLYFMCAPIDLSGKTVNISVACGGEEDSETIEFEADGKNLVAAGGYLLKEKEPPYLTFSAASTQTFKMEKNGNYTLHESMQYSVGGGAWTQLFLDTEIPFGGDGNDLRLRGKSSTGTANENKSAYCKITFTDANVMVACTGDIRTLVDWGKYATADTKDARFIKLFNGCTVLITAPELPATTLATNCYSNMFDGCTSLTTAPALPATVLAESCYFSMFNYCLSLETAPVLPAETLAKACYRSMFSGCTSLETAPVLPAVTLVESCYAYMFYGCTNLNNVTMLATDINADSCLEYWLKDVASEGTFTKAAGLAQGTGDGQIRTGSSSGIPTGWTVVDYTESE